ncbi:MAG TPA: orotidine-5'-phosphate decarboxylase [Beutenbergiaceae bacterium]|nr:orotidine-5'-phosphate decarboxylase [Beutenbergiaceae bacterium]
MPATPGSTTPAPAPDAAPEPFGTRLAQAMDTRGPVCVGIDPHAELIRRWGYPNDAEGLREFSLRALEALSPHVAAVKPQAAFFERFGSAGVQVLAEVLAQARAAGVVCILDAKRGDIGSTMSAYAQAYLCDGSDLAADAVTLAAYVGYEALRPALDAAARSGRGVFVLGLTSNPEGASVQHARTAGGATVAAEIARQAAADNALAVAGGARWGHAGLVVGATVADAIGVTGTELSQFKGPLLAPGLGAQGADAAQLADTFGPALPAVLASASRSVLRAGPDPRALADAARALAADVARATGRA